MSGDNVNAKQDERIEDPHVLSVVGGVPWKLRHLQASELLNHATASFEGAHDVAGELLRRLYIKSLKRDAKGIPLRVSRGETWTPTPASGTDASETKGTK